MPPPTARLLPTATFGATRTVILGQPVAPSLTNAQVPGFSGTVTFSYAFDCGGGTYATASATASASCATTAVGARTVRGKVLDQESDFTAYTASVTVLSAAQATTSLRTLVLNTQAQRGKAIPIATADAWIAQAIAIRTAAGC